MSASDVRFEMRYGVEPLFGDDGTGSRLGESDMQEVQQRKNGTVERRVTAEGIEAKARATVEARNLGRLGRPAREYIANSVE